MNYKQYITTIQIIKKKIKYSIYLNTYLFRFNFYNTDIIYCVYYVQICLCRASGLFRIYVRNAFERVQFYRIYFKEIFLKIINVNTTLYETRILFLQTIRIL